jgi:hypothetical protein
MRIIEEISQQMAEVGPSYVNRVTLSQPAYEELLEEKNEFNLYQVDPEAVPPTVYGVAIKIIDEPCRNVTVLAAGF